MDLVIHFKMVDNMILHSIKKGKLSSILTNWWVALLGL